MTMIGRMNDERDLPDHVAIGLVVVLVLALTAWLGTTLGAVHYADQADEGWYLRYMQTIGARGPSAFRDLFDQYLADSKAWIYPNPLRVGFIAVSAVWSTMFGATLTSLSWLSLASHLLFVVVNFVFARRHFGNLRATALAYSTAFSPPLLGLARRALSDSFTTLCATVSVWLFLELLIDPRSTRKRVVFASVFFCALLVKETIVILAVVFAGIAAWRRWIRSSELPIAATVLALALPVAACGLVYVVAAGGVEPVWKLTSIIISSPGTNPYAIQFGSGPWFSYLIDLIALSPGKTLLALLGFGALVARPRAEPD